MGEVLHLECDVMHLELRAADKIHRVMIWVTAQENEIILDPVRYPEAQHTTVEIRHRLRILDNTSDVPELERARAQNLVVETRIAQSLKRSNLMPGGSAKGQIFPD